MKLMTGRRYPEGVPKGIGRGACEMFLATTPACIPFEGRVVEFVPAEGQLHAFSGKNISCYILYVRI